MSKRTSILISGAAALAFVGMMGTPAEASCIACTITAGTTNPGPVVPLDLGTGGGGGFINATTINNPSPNISSIVFTTAGTAPGSGLYSGSVLNVAASPYPNGPGSSVPPAPTNKNYLVAQGGGGTVTITFKNAQTRLDLIWGTVDENPLTYNVVTTNALTPESINGADIATAAGVSGGGNTNVFAQITGLNKFTVATFSASDVAFEFNVGTPVPEPGSLALLGTALVGLGFLGRRRRKLA